MKAISLRNKLFYLVKPAIPRFAQIRLRRYIACRHRKKLNNEWYIDPNSVNLPAGWPGWPNGKQFALVLSHDVDTIKGYNTCRQLAALEEELGFRSSFNFVPERYTEISPTLISEFRRKGFDIAVHGLKHDGKLFMSKGIFDKSAIRINYYLEKWQSSGFTAPSMISNHSWMSQLNIRYAISTFDADPFEPFPKGVGTIFPFWVPGVAGAKGFLELPYTLPQDFTLFVILREKNINLWIEKLKWIAKHGGLALINTHPDYMNFSGQGCGQEEYSYGFYREFLEHVKVHYPGRYWPALPSQVYEFLSSYSTCHDSALQNLGDADRVSYFN